ncbi:BTAD domain-containing putative transcriptional regulator [Streptosporangium sp. V21-05]|uniref:BTAD domain-containing putative transcriptional regulator n=1 Tax=Streptosporangium sp. V21-05 TaxID=3446115 RepID=UPI003F52C428
MEFRVLGSVEGYDDGVRLALGGPRPRKVLARLLLAGGAVVSADTLIDDLYGGAPPASALASLQSYVSNLRRIIEPGRGPRTSPRLLLGQSSGYLLATTDVDAVRFTELVTGGEFRPPAEALASFDRALRLWRGLPYGEFADEPWAVTEVNRLHGLRLIAVERRSQALLDLGRPQTVVSDLEGEALAHPLRERLWYLLALALYRTGRQADALATLRRARSLLTEQLGLGPGLDLRELEQDILRHAEPLAPPAALTVAAPPPPAPPGGLLGRERQLSELGALPARGGVTVAAVSGEPGIGKTRLLEAFGDHCADLGHLVLWGRCHDSEGAPALWPWPQVFTALERHCPPPDRLALTGLLDDETPGGSGGATPLRRHQAIARWLATAALAQPLVIILDDLHRADPASLELLRDLIALIGGLPETVTLTLVTAFRDTASTRGTFGGNASGLSVEDLLGKLTGYDPLRLRLAGLDDDAVRAIAADMGAELDRRAARRLTERTGGNPFFVRETVRLLAEGRTLDDLPDAVADLIGRRITALAARAGEVLGVAAVIGGDFDPAVVAEVCRAEVYEVYDLLDQAARAGLVAARAGRMVFVHDLVRETLIQNIPPMRRAVIHRDVMTTLSTRPNVNVALIAHHAVEAGPTAYAEAVRWARAAAEQAASRQAYREAAMWWGRAIDAHGDSVGDLAGHVELLLLHAHALTETGDPIGARRVRAKAVRAADRAGAGPELTARALTALDAPAIWPFRDPYEVVERQLVHRFDATLRALPATDGPERARLLGGLAQELCEGTDDPRRRSLSAEAVEMARRLRDPHLLMRTLNARHLALPQPLCVPELLEITDELDELATRMREPGFMLLAQMMYTHLRLETFDLAGAERAAARCDVLLERLPLPLPRFQHTLWRACRLVLKHRFDEAEALYEEAGGQAERIGVWHASGIVAMGRLSLNYQRGTMAETGPLIDAIAGVHPCMDHDARVLRLCARGDVEEAGRLAGKGRRPPPRDGSWLSATCLRAAAQAAAGCVSACQVSYSALLPYGGRLPTLSGVISMGPVDWFLSLLASATGDHEAASRHLTTLARQAGQSGLTAWRDRAMAAAAALPPPLRSATLRDARKRWGNP